MNPTKLFRSQILFARFLCGWSIACASLPAGYDYDACPPEVIMNDMQVRDGRIVLPDGMSYTVLALSDTGQMTLPLLRKVRELVMDGATVSGPRPLRSPSLADAANEVDRLAQQVWGDVNGNRFTHHNMKRGIFLALRSAGSTHSSPPSIPFRTKDRCQYP